MRSAALVLPLLVCTCGPHLQRRPEPPDVQLRAPAPTLMSRRGREASPEPLAVLDDDGDGVVDDRELGRDVERTFAVLDRDEDGAIHRTELVVFVADDADAALARWDVDDDGAIQREELTTDETTQSQHWRHRYGVPTDGHPGY